jgi:hypothetical protein
MISTKKSADDTADRGTIARIPAIFMRVAQFLATVCRGLA